MQQGINQDGWRDFGDIIVKSNVIQLIIMQNVIRDEIKKRHNRKNKSIMERLADVLVTE